jgi:hypothetical protein
MKSVKESEGISLATHPPTAVAEPLNFTLKIAISENTLLKQISIQTSRKLSSNLITISSRDYNSENVSHLGLVGGDTTTALSGAQ